MLISFVVQMDPVHSSVEQHRRPTPLKTKYDLYDERLMRYSELCTIMMKAGCLWWRQSDHESSNEKPDFIDSLNKRENTKMMFF